MGGIHEGLWAMQIGDRLGVIPVGVIAFKQDALFGGNDKYFYTGDYQVEDDTFRATVNITHYNDIPGSLFGAAKELPLSLCGVISEVEMDLVGVLPTRSDMEYMVRLHKLSGFPD